MTVLTASNINKRYKNQQVLKSLELSVNEGDAFGFLGPNGAGKTTFIKIMLGLVTPQSGEIELMGIDLFKNRNEAIKKVGAVVEAPIFFEYMTGLDNLTYLVSLTRKIPQKDIMQMLELVGLAEAAHKKVGKYSYGMKQRLGIAQALLPDTKFLILDEPTNGLDPHGISGVRSLIHKLRTELGVTIFLSSHLLTEVQQCCNKVCIIHHGEKLMESDVDALDEVEAVILKAKTNADLDLERFNLIEKTKHDDITEFRFDIDRPQIPELVNYFSSVKAEIYEVRELERSLEDIFINLTKDKELDVRIDSFGS